MTPTPQTRHLLNRFSWGVTPALVKEAKLADGARAWLEGQLKPAAIDDSAAIKLRGWFHYLASSPADLWNAVQSGTTTITTISLDLARWTMLRRLYSRRQLHEVMTAFWSDFLHIPSTDAASWPHRIAYDATLRQHALGRFDQMLNAVVTHPAMGGYLDNARSTRLKLNENLGREVLELYTVGVNAGYSERQVVDSARILTGFRVDLFDTWEATYNPADHYVGRVQVLDFSAKNNVADGRPLTARYLNHLAHHPATAQRIARRLCVRFVSDNPPPSIITAVAESYLSSGTSIPAALRTLVDHPAFSQAVGAKVRTPLEDTTATHRVLGLDVHRPRTSADFGNAIVFYSNCMGQRPFEWPRPDGPPDAAEAYTSVSRLLASWTAHQSLAGGYTPSAGVTYRPLASWLPALPATVGDIADHVCRSLLARPSTRGIRRAAALRVGMPVSREISSAGSFGEQRIVQVIAAVLDTPEHMTR